MVSNEKKNAEEAQSESEKRFHNFAAASSDWFWEMDNNFRFTFFSEQYSEVTGVSLDKLLGRTRKELGIPDIDPDEWESHLATLDAHEPFRNFIHPRTRPDGEVVWLSINGNPVFDSNGVFKGYRGTGSDITPEVEAEMAQRESEARFRDYAEVSSDWFWEMDSDLRFTSFSGRMAETEELLRNIVGKTRWELVGGEPDKDPVWREHQATLEFHKPFRKFVYSIVNSEGGTQWLQTSGVPVFDENGTFRGYRGSGIDITDLREAEKDARYLSNAVEALSECLSVYDADDRFIFCNSGFRDLNSAVPETLAPGVRFEDHLRALLEKGLVPKAIGREEEWLRERMERHRNPTDPFENLRQDGRWLLTYEQRLPDGGTITLSTDITEQKKVEQALRESEAQLRDAQKLAGLGYFERDLDTNILSWSDESYRIFGESKESFETSLQAFREFTHPEDRDRVFEITQKAITENQSYEFDFRIQRRDGAVRYINTLGRSIRGPDDKPVKLVGTMQDVTERKHAEEALKASQARFSEILDIAPEAVINIGADMDILLFNKSAERIFGYNAAEVLGHPLDILMPEFFRENHRRHIEEFERSGDNYRFMDHRQEILGLRKDGTEFPASASVSKLEIGDEKLYTVMLQDITDRKVLEEQLRRSQKMEAVGQLTGGIAHDFNNLLNIVMGKAELLEFKIEGNEKSQRDIDAIIGAVRRGASLTQRLLAFSRKQTLSPQPTAINGLVLGLADMLQRSLGETVELRTAFETGVCEALIDQHQFENALINLAVNAKHAMPKGGTLTIKTADITLDEAYATQHEEVTPGDYVEITVSDTGIGMSPEVLKKVFDPFFTTKDVGEGSGLGLSMVYGFAKQSNGQITIDSEEGHGTTVKLYLPRSHEAPAKDNIKDETPEFALGSERILVVEDDDAVREISTDILRNQGYEVFLAKDGEEAIARLKRGPSFDLLFTDIVLPGGMNGVEIADEAKRLQPGIKVLYTTGYADDAFAHNDTQVRDMAVINKPYRRAELLERVHEIIDRADN